MTFRATRGIGAYFKIVAAMPGTTSDVASAAELKRDNALDIMRRLHVHGLIRVLNWQAPIAGGNICEVWGLGPGADCPLPIGRRLRPRKRTPFRSGAYQFVQLWRALEDGMTVRDLNELLGLHKVAIYEWMKQAKKLKLVHVGGWERQSQGPAIRIYKLGNKRDADYPAPVGKVEVNRRHWAKRTARLRQSVMLSASAGPIA